MESKGGGQGRIYELQQDGIFRRKHKGPGTKTDEEVHCETLGKSFTFWVTQFPYSYNNKIFQPVSCCDGIKSIKSDNALKRFLSLKRCTNIVIKRSRCRKEGSRREE